MKKGLLLIGICVGLLVFLSTVSLSRPESALLEPDNLPAPEKPVATKPVQIKATPQRPRQNPEQQTPPPTPIRQVVERSVVKPVAIKSNTFPVRRCMNMGNALEAPNEGEWGYKIRAQDFQTLARAGFDTVRIPVRWDAHTSHKAPYKIDARFMARVQTVVAQAQAAGLGVIIDVHHYESLMTHTNREEPRFLSIWAQIADSFSGAPANVYFELLNEPTLEISPARLNALYAKTVPLIRKTNPTRKLILGGNSWNSVESLAKVKFPKDDNLVATFHDYGPHEFTHQGAPWMDPKMPMGRRWGSKVDYADLKTTYSLAKKFKAKSDMPVLVGEFGVYDKVPQEERNQWIKTRRQAMEAAGFAWCAWDFSGAFKSYNTSSERWAPGIKDAFFEQ